MFLFEKLKSLKHNRRWITPGGDEELRQTPRRTTMERNFMAIVAVTKRGSHYFEVLNLNESVNSERYIQFLNRLIIFLRNLNPPILPENMRLIQGNASSHMRW